MSDSAKVLIAMYATIGVIAVRAMLVGVIQIPPPGPTAPDTVYVTDTVRVLESAKPPLSTPVEGAQVRSPFSRSRYHPILERWRPHRGIDFAADYNTTVRAAGAGVVTHLGRLGGLGLTAVIRHPQGFVTRYGHLQNFTPNLQVGDWVCQGDPVGYAGSTGLATGPHVHYETLRDGTHVDPAKYLGQ